MESFLLDVRQAIRSARRAPGVILLAVVALGLGVGATLAVFSAIDALVLRAYDIPEPERVVQIWDRYPAEASGREVQVSVPNFEDYQERQRVFQRFAAMQPTTGYRSEGDRTESVYGLYASPDLLPLLGVQPVLGRGFTDEEDLEGTAAVVILSYDLWQNVYGGAPEVIGGSFELVLWSQQDRAYVTTPFEIVGVLPPGFRMPALRLGHDYTAWNTPDFVLPRGLWEWGRGNRGQYAYRVLGRLRPMRSIEEAQDDLSAIAAEIAEAHPQTNAGYTTVLTTLPGLARAEHGSRMLLLWSAAAVLLLIACANVAALLIGRGIARQREVALRQALGSGMRRILSQLLTEGALIALSGGALALVVAYLGLLALRPFVPGNVPNLDAMGLDARVLGLALAASLGTALIFALAPAVGGRRLDLAQALKEGESSAARPTRALRMLVVGQVALAFVLLSSAGLLLASLSNMLGSDPGFEPDGRVALQVRSLPPGLSKYQDGEARERLSERVIAALQAHPGVVRAASTANLPLSGRESRADFTPGDRPALSPQEREAADWLYASPGYFETLGIPVLEGREFNQADLDARRVARASWTQGMPLPELPVLVNAELARRYWPGESALGKIIYWGIQDPETVTTDGGESWDSRYPMPFPLRIVGVVGSVNQLGIGDERRLQYYTAERRLDWLVVHVRGEAADFVLPLRAVVEGVDPEIEVAEAFPMTQRVEIAAASTRFQLLLVGLFGVIATAMAVLGLFGVLSYSVQQRRREIGVRMSLGATSANVRWLVLRQGSLLVVLGVAAGTAGAWAAGRLLESLLFGVRPAAPGVLLATAVGISAVALIACILPTRHASRVDPVLVLREDGWGGQAT